MAKGRKMKGFNKVLKNLNKEIKGIQNRTKAGLWAGGLTLQREAQINLKDSVVTGNLRASAYTRTSSKFKRYNARKLDRDKCASDPAGEFPATVEVGFTALYAIFVHEDLEKNYRTPKYLQKAIQEHQDKILNQIRQRAKVK